MYPRHATTQQHPTSWLWLHQWDIHLRQCCLQQPCQRRSLGRLLSLSLPCTLRVALQVRASAGCTFRPARIQTLTFPLRHSLPSCSECPRQMLRSCAVVASRVILRYTGFAALSTTQTRRSLLPRTWYIYIYVCERRPRVRANLLRDAVNDTSTLPRHTERAPSCNAQQHAHNSQRCRWLHVCLEPRPSPS